MNGWICQATVQASDPLLLCPIPSGIVQPNWPPKLTSSQTDLISQQGKRRIQSNIEFDKWGLVGPIYIVFIRATE